MSRTSSNNVNFQALFESGPGLYLILQPNFTIVAASNAYLRATQRSREELLGKNIFDAFPDNPDDPDATGVKNLNASLKTVLGTKAPHTMAVQKYDIRIAQSEGVFFEERHWSPVNTPILDDNGEISYIAHRVEDVTEFVKLKRMGQEQSRLTEELQHRTVQMETEIFTRAQEIQKHNREIEILNDELQLARDQSIESSQLKSAFLANMSHELRTPLGVILGMVEILSIQNLSEDQKEMTALIEQSGRSLLALVNDILDLSKIEAGKMSFELESFNPISLVEAVIHLLKPQAQQKDLLLIFE